MEVAIVGAGIAGIATAYYLSVAGRNDVVLIESGQPMGLTSAQSGENYRNWWPHPVMTAFTDASIGLLEAIARDSGNRIRITRRGYALATRRENVGPLIADLHAGYGAAAGSRIRVHERAGGYVADAGGAWEAAPDGVDVLLDQDLIARTFPSFARDVTAVLHVRRAGDISGQQLGMFMLERIRARGGRVATGRVVGIERGEKFGVRLADGGQVEADVLVNAAGPYVAGIASLLGETLPVKTVLQQKITFEDRDGAIPRGMPFAIDLDGQSVDWSAEERAALAEDPELTWRTAPMPGGIHCRPDGAGRWIKLGWAYNRTATEVVAEPAFDPHFPETVLRGASRLNPALRGYYGRLPRPCVHYGGYYTMTQENWPLIGPMATPGAFVVGALSGYGTMSACAAGSLAADWIGGHPLPAYAAKLSLARHGDVALMAELTRMQNDGAL